MGKYYKISCQDSAGEHQIAYQEWGDRHQEKVLICVHGLTRNSQDFTKLAEALQVDYRVICPDVVGRGQSDWLSSSSDYGLPLYVADLLTLLQELNLTAVDWLGTSMGGLIGMSIAYLKQSPIRRLILNDVGPWIPPEAVERIAKYLCQAPPIFEDLIEVREYVKKVYSSFGNLTESQWQDLGRFSVSLNHNNQYILNYDPAIAKPFKCFKSGHFKPVDLWQVWNSIACPVLLLHGENSDLLLPETIEQMLVNHPLLEVEHLPDCGHAPALMSQLQINIVKKWLNSTG
jgi:pimeloyl-ACP methyl ester carboxylesterase